MSTATLAAERSGLRERLADYVELTKPRIVVLELVAIVATLHMASGYGAAGGPWGLGMLFGVSLGVGLVAASANAINMWLERELDGLMVRTADRPLPAGRLSPAEVLTFGLTSCALGAVLMTIAAGWPTAILALASWFVYVACYTPLKTRSWTNTAVGAVSGALPILVGWCAGGGAWNGVALALFGVMYIWQFPHFMAIAWLCREDYTAAGYHMSPVLDPSGKWAGAQAVVGSALLLPVSLLPLISSRTIDGVVYFVFALLAWALLQNASSAFLADRNDRTARRLLRVSLLYVPLWLFGLWLAGV
ncbi:Protoheme IX farnesyltransferase 2 [Pseudobythopirellula maris]|uniref:Protoheme IX farnesyltransferase n=1 Tax=Pseudobythopirellula maris TaxID=2527991 RepID=A0A5C5ZIV1_9BACT|nr:heme o synthase [Pseudobythopirellula maris]TWT87279.1 Protoheme IX farnesyltransferase 2 [Pseudobythopirellula maris]